MVDCNFITIDVDSPVETKGTIKPLHLSDEVSFKTLISPILERIEKAHMNSFTLDGEKDIENRKR